MSKSPVSDPVSAMHIKPRAIPYLAIVLSLFLFSSELHAGGFSILDIGTRRCCMMAVMADADDPTAVYHNPACLADQEGTQLYFFGMATHVDAGFRLRDAEGSLGKTIKPTRSLGIAPFLGITSDFGLERWTFGSAIYFPNFYGAALEEDAPTRYHAYQALFITGYFSFAAACEITDSLSIGGTFNLIYTYLTGARKMDLLGDNDPERDFDVEIESDDYLTSWSLALRYQPDDRWRFGLAIWPREDLFLTGDLRVDGPDDSAVVRSYYNCSMLIPASLRMGASYWFRPDWQVALDLNFWRYSDYTRQKVETGVDDLFGDMSTTKEYDDSYSVALGFLHQQTPRSSILFGILRDWSPIPEEYYTVDNPNADLWSAAGGYRFDVNSFLQMTLGLNFTYYETVDIDNSKTDPPTNAKGEAFGYEINFDLLYTL